MATAATLFFVPAVFSFLHRTVPVPAKRESDLTTPALGINPAPANA
jgi:hypothetical protein